MTVTEVKIWLLRKHLTREKIVGEYGCNHSFVSQFVNGNKTSQGLVDYLTDKGCPRKYFKNGRVAA